MTSEFSESDPEAACVDLDDMTPEQLHAMIDRLEFTDDRVEIDLAPDDDADRVSGMWPRPVAIPDDLYVRAQLRASELNLSWSAYVRHVIEHDLATTHANENPHRSLPLMTREEGRR
ncbi:hypothetical protein [Nocardia camponoti]|uniref:Uncharacterized protein n=1 Tax=Nocardia camponoti TaxID=1616106 RepID=A0A917VAN7_9NOCA|nr:hypothetical protein [Nocardia camponoti]GGK54897.1 hypothetical protein GCM10011591_28470 [Nocardia camponoti]